MTRFAPLYKTRSLFYTNVLRKFFATWIFYSFFENRSFFLFSRLCWHCLRVLFLKVFLMSNYCSERYLDVSFQFLNINFEFWSHDHYFVKIFNYIWIAATFCLSFYFAIHVSGVAEFFDKIYSIPIFMVKSLIVEH